MIVDPGFDRSDIASLQFLMKLNGNLSDTKYIVDKNISKLMKYNLCIYIYIYIYICI